MIDFDAPSHLKSLTNIPDADIDLGLAALSFSAVESLPRYIIQLEKLQQSVAARYQALIISGSDDDARTQLAALKHVLSDEHDYHLDRPDAEILENADLARVIERRKGIAAAISILFIRTGRELGWNIDGLAFPGTMLCRLEKDGERLIFDAGRQCRLLDAPDLREMLKKMNGPNAELSASYFETLSNREILIALQNNIKLRCIEMGEYLKAIKVIKQMQTLDPKEYRLMLDAGVLYAKTHQYESAIKNLESYISKAPNGRDRQEALMLLHEIKDGFVV